MQFVLFYNLQLSASLFLVIPLGKDIFEKNLPQGFAAVISNSKDFGYCEYTKYQ
jgi:hypothetical protein